MSHNTVLAISGSLLLGVVVALLLAFGIAAAHLQAGWLPLPSAVWSHGDVTLKLNERHAWGYEEYSFWYSSIARQNARSRTSRSEINKRGLACLQDYGVPDWALTQIASDSNSRVSGVGWPLRCCVVVDSPLQPGKMRKIRVLRLGLFVDSVLFAAAPLCVSLVRPLRRRIRAAKRLCVRCGYPVVASRCPECGTRRVQEPCP